MNAVRYHSEEGNRLAVVVKEGHKWTHLVWIDYPIRLRKVKKTEERYFKSIPDGNPERIARQMLEAGRGAFGITKGAEQALKEVLA